MWQGIGRLRIAGLGVSVKSLLGARAGGGSCGFWFC